MYKYCVSKYMYLYVINVYNKYTNKNKTNYRQQFMSQSSNNNTQILLFFLIFA